MRVILVMMERGAFYISELDSGYINLDFCYINLNFFGSMRGLIVIRVEEKNLHKAIKSIESIGYRFTLRY